MTVAIAGIGPQRLLSPFMTEQSNPADPRLPGLPQPPSPISDAPLSRHRPPPPGSTQPGSTQSSQLPVATEPPAPAGVFGPSVFRAILCGIAGAFVGAAVWYGLVVFTDRQFVYVAIGLGLAIGYSTSWGAAKGGVVPAIISALIGALAVIGAYYFINRHLIIASGEELGISYDVPLIPTYDELKIVLRIGYEADGSQYVFSGLSIAAAAFFGYKGVHTSRGYTGSQVPR
jgi:hypothetical protein